MTGKSTAYDDPNRQAIGLDPIWTGAGEPEPEPPVEPERETKPAKSAKSTEPEGDHDEVT